MDTLRLAIEYAMNPGSGFMPALGRHLQLSLVALGIAAVIGVALGIAASRWRPAAAVLNNAAGIVRVINEHRAGDQQRDRRGDSGEKHQLAA